MKSFKIVFASLMIAALGIVGFSSFKSEAKAPAKKFDQVTLIYNGSGWSTGNPAALCSGEGVLCGITFDDEEISAAEAKDFAIHLNLSTQNSGSVTYPNSVTVYEKN